MFGVVSKRDSLKKQENPTRLRLARLCSGGFRLTLEWGLKALGLEQARFRSGGLDLDWRLSN
jgi:hypothetical protein